MMFVGLPESEVSAPYPASQLAGSDSALARDKGCGLFEPCHFILSFDNGASSEHGTFSITDWIDLTPKDMLANNFGLTKDVFDVFPKGETYIQAGPVLPASQAIDAPWPKESTHKFSLLKDIRARRDFDGGTLNLATVDEWPISKTMSGALMVIKPGRMKQLHWNPNANEFHFYLKGKGQVALFGSDGRGKVAEVKAGTPPTSRPVTGTQSRNIFASGMRRVA
jgi:oxalate decarboxylase